jgi:hypothetical protein
LAEPYGGDYEPIDAGCQRQSELRELRTAIRKENDRPRKRPGRLYRVSGLVQRLRITRGAHDTRGAVGCMRVLALTRVAAHAHTG